MIESREEEALLVQHRQLVRELNDYRKVAAHLKKELRFKDSKHSYIKTFHSEECIGKRKIY